MSTHPTSALLRYIDPTPTHTHTKKLSHLQRVNSYKTKVKPMRTKMKTNIKRVILILVGQVPRDKEAAAVIQTSHKQTPPNITISKKMPSRGRMTPSFDPGIWMVSKSRRCQ